MKKELKQLAKRHFPNVVKKWQSDTVLTLDFALSQDGSLVLLGWFLNRNTSVSGETIKLNGLKGRLFTFSRADVMSRYSVTDADKCNGFICVLESVDTIDLESAQLEFMGNHYSVQKLAPMPVNSATELLNHVAEDRDLARKFLKANNIKLDKVEDTSELAVVQLDPDVARIKNIVSSIDLSGNDFVESIKRSVLKDVQKIWKQRVGSFTAARLQTYGPEMLQPKVSVIIPLYGRYDFIQYQLSAFSNDPFFQQVELIYVLDDPRLAREVQITAKGVFEIFRQPFKIVFSNENRGFAGANNVGVQYASSENLLLLNSDILPKELGWLARLLKQFEETEDCGILGATLLYEDGTIQHKGMEFAQDSHYPGIFINHHPYKGIPNNLVTKEDVFSAQLVTGACMLMKKELFERVEGFDPMYVLGDFEDSDLCLKVIEQGYKIYCSSVELFHLERLSQDLVASGSWKFKLTITNGVYQDTKWNTLIEEMSKK